MIELPSAAMAVGDIAGETDFLSIGTNDLPMYLLAIRRLADMKEYLETFEVRHPGKTAPSGEPAAAGVMV